MAFRYALVNYNFDEYLARHPKEAPSENLVSTGTSVINLLKILAMESYRGW